MPVIDPADSLVLVGATAAGPFTEIAELTSYDYTRGRDATRRRFVFGDAAARLKGGSKTSTYRLGGLMDLGDTDGQDVLRAAYENDTTIALVITEDGETGTIEEGKVTEYTGRAEREGDYVEVTFTFEGTSVRSAWSAPEP